MTKTELLNYDFDSELEYKTDLTEQDISLICDVFVVNMQEGKLHHKQVNSCKAWEVSIRNSRRFTALRSYDTIVGICDNTLYKYYSLGRFSRSTYGQESKFLANKHFFEMPDNGRNFEKIQLHFYDGFDFGNGIYEDAGRYYPVTK